MNYGKEVFDQNNEMVVPRVIPSIITKLLNLNEMADSLNNILGDLYSRSLGSYPQELPDEKQKGIPNGELSEVSEHIRTLEMRIANAIGKANKMLEEL